MEIMYVSQNEAILVNDLKEPFPSDKYKEVIAHLQNGCTQRRKEEAISMISNTIENSRWEFPTRRSDIFASGPCVYFMLAKSKPGQIKIGHSVNLSARTRAFKSEYGNVKIIAFIKTDRRVSLETTYHALFDKHNIRGKWFESKPVIDYLKKQKTLTKKQKTYRYEPIC